jgi:PAS domain S-box-containing protein
MALAFCLGGVAVLATARHKVRSVHMLVSITVGLLLILASPVVLLTNICEIFVRPAGASIFGATGIAIAGLALLVSMCRKSLPSIALGHLLPLLVGAVGVASTIVVWLGLNSDQNHRIQRQLQLEVANLQRLTHDRLVQHTNGVVTLSENWPNTAAEKRKDSIGSYVGQLPGCLGVAQIDGTLNINWVESILSTNLPQAFADLGVSEPLAQAVHEGRTIALQPPRSSWRGVRVMVVFAAHRNGAPDGGLLSVIRVQDLFSAIINTSVAPGYAVTVLKEAPNSNNEEVIFTRYDSERKYQQWNQTLPLNYERFPWHLSLSPTQAVLERESLSLPKLALMLGLLTTGLLALAVHLAQTARRRTFALENEVHERELTQCALTQSEEKYRTLIENLGQGIFLQDCEHRYVAANVQFCKSVGRREAEIVGATEADLFEPQRAATLAEELRTVLAEGKRVETEEDSLADGRRTCIRRVLTPVHDASGRTTGVLGICWDVTEQRQLEVHVHQASKMDAIGQLAGGIAHDFNNLLTVILGNLELMLMDLPGEDPIHDLAISARNAAARATSLTQRLLGFSRRHQLDWMSTNLNATVEEVVELLQRTIDPLIRIETHFASGLWPIQADTTQLNQVLMNLCLNARDAIAGAGKIAIETACVTASELSGTNGRNTRTGDFVRLRVTDTGSGMPPEVKARMYEPFFTTKEVGKGTGLGLPMVFAIVRQHKGWIECWSEVGKGTRFDIYLPRGEPSNASITEPVPTAPRRTGKETILVVDDEEMIRQLAAATLQTSGYTVLQAEDGQQAIDLYSREGDRIDLVLLDLTMPILSGHEAFRHLLALNPRVRVLFASGYAVEQLSDLEKELMAGFVNKPYRPNELVLAVQEALQRRTQSGSADREDNSPVPTRGQDRTEIDSECLAQFPEIAPEQSNRDHVLVPE